MRSTAASRLALVVIIAGSWYEWSTSSPRIADEGVALASVVLMYALGTMLFTSEWFGVLAAALLVTTPAYLGVRETTRAYYLLPFIMAWSIALLRFARTREARWLAVAGALLGAALSSHTVALVLVPMYIALTIGYLSMTEALRRRPMLAFALGFSLTAAAFFLTLAAHPQDLRDTITRLSIYDANRLNVLQGIREITTWVGLTARSEIYYDYFNPTFLFFPEGRTIASNLTHPGFFVIPFALLLPFGLYQLWRTQSAATSWLLTGGFLCAPAAAALAVRPNHAGWVIVMAPFAVAIATCGVQSLCRSRSAVVQSLGIGALAAIAVCVVAFVSR